MPGKWTMIAGLAVLLAGCTETAVDVPDVPDVPTIVSIRIDDVSTELLPGGTVQVVAHAVGAKGEELFGQLITFSGNSPAFATVSPTGLMTMIAPGTVRVTASGGGRTGTREFIVNFPVPTIASITPTSVPAVAAAVITVQGTGFLAGTVVRMNGAMKSTTVVSNTELRVSLATEDVATAGAAAITVFNPAPGGGTSGSLTLTVRTGPVCDFVASLTLGTPVAGLLDPTDCNNGTAAAPSYRDSYNFTTTVPTGVTFSLLSSAFNPLLLLTDATNSVTVHALASATRPMPALLRLLLPASTFAVLAGMRDSNALGAYTLASSASAAPDVTNCDTWYVVPPMNLTQTVTKADCGLAPHEAGNISTRATGMHEWYWDEYRIFLRAGQTITITLESTAFDAALWLADSNGHYVATNDNSGAGTNAEIVFTAPAHGMYRIEAAPSQAIGAIGVYTIRVR